MPKSPIRHSPIILFSDAGMVISKSLVFPEGICAESEIAGSASQLNLIEATSSQFSLIKRANVLSLLEIRSSQK